MPSVVFGGRPMDLVSLFLRPKPQLLASCEDASPKQRPGDTSLLQSCGLRNFAKRYCHTGHKMRYTHLLGRSIGSGQEISLNCKFAYWCFSSGYYNSGNLILRTYSLYVTIQLINYIFLLTCTLTTFNVPPFH